MWLDSHCHNQNCQRVTTTNCVTAKSRLCDSDKPNVCDSWEPLCVCVTGNDPRVWPEMSLLCGQKYLRQKKLTASEEINWLCDGTRKRKKCDKHIGSSTCDHWTWNLGCSFGPFQFVQLTSIQPCYCYACANLIELRFLFPQYNIRTRNVPHPDFDCDSRRLAPYHSIPIYTKYMRPLTAQKWESRNIMWRLFSPASLT